ncbi:MAG: UDP-N-acetylmuramoyl-tripeptide--D-alanyl-D-alanine ligase [bacterium]|nr:UDP-N-acetylmuramoyl-tripeptide--D-alanyl-D-alanine ligase [bacterium]
MDENAFIIILAIWIPQAIYQALSWIYWIQVKEYRMDRFLLLFDSRDGRKNLEIYLIILKLILLLAAAILQNPLFIFIAFLFCNFNLFLAIVQRRMRRPIWTLRAQRLFGTSLFAVGFALVAYFLLNQSLFTVFLVGEAIVLLSPFIGIIWTTPSVLLTKNKEIKLAKAHLEKFKPTVVGITGSYGKTTTKEFVAHLLSQKYDTAKTTGSENTEFGIARKTMSFVQETTKFFVVEMGAYKLSEIKKLSSIVSPSVGVITGIESQHLSLFGSLENIIKAKYELVESLPRGGIAIFNLSNKYCQRMYSWAKKEKRWKVYGYFFRKAEKGKISKRADLVTQIIRADIDGVDFEVLYKGQKKKLLARLHGTHFIENLAGSILVAKLLGVSWEEISSGCKTIAMPEKIMEVYRGLNDLTIIDDSYNSTPHGFIAALKYLSLFPNKKKFVVTSGIIELGETSHRIHNDLGTRMKQEVNKIYLTNGDFYNDIVSGLEGKEKLILANDKGMLEKMIDKLKIENDAVVLLEGRMPSIVTTALRAQ